MQIKNLCKSYGQTVVLDNFSLSLEENTITCLTGESGCGKTTLLNLIAGLSKPDSGAIEYEGKVSYLFQEPRLLPWKTVLENVQIALNEEKKAREILQLVGLEDSLDKYPSELSGGMSQRVAMARAFAFPSDVLLMDEPFQNLDIKLKNNLLQQFIKLWEQNPKTVLWVTHDITEACLAADRILCVAKGPAKGQTQGPMHIVDSYEIKIARSERTVESTSPLQAKIYNALV
jgi:NitT/TauT family transport system ATP-binding protein